MKYVIEVRNNKKEIVRVELDGGEVYLLGDTFYTNESSFSGLIAVGEEVIISMLHEPDLFKKFIGIKVRGNSDLYFFSPSSLVRRQPPVDHCTGIVAHHKVVGNHVDGHSHIHLGTD